MPARRLPVRASADDGTNCGSDRANRPPLRRISAAARMCGAARTEGGG